MNVWLGERCSKRMKMVEPLTREQYRNVCCSCRLMSCHLSATPETSIRGKFILCISAVFSITGGDTSFEDSNVPNMYLCIFHKDVMYCNNMNCKGEGTAPNLANNLMTSILTKGAPSCLLAVGHN